MSETMQFLFVLVPLCFEFVFWSLDIICNLPFDELRVVSLSNHDLLFVILALSELSINLYIPPPNLLAPGPPSPSPFRASLSPEPNHRAAASLSGRQ